MSEREGSQRERGAMKAGRSEERAQSRRLVVEADGGSRGNPGPAGYGAVVRDADTGEVLAERAAAIGRATNNVAEYSGLIAGLGAALELDPESVEVRLDSKLAVEQMSGRWRVKHPDLAPLHARARELAGRLPSVRYVWVPRARNTHADRLANEAMDAAAAGRPWSREASPADTDPEADSASAGQRPASSWRTTSAPPTTLLLVRHGETELSGKRFSGRGDAPLSARGEEQAAAVAKRLSTVDGVAAVVASPLRRARSTAAAVGAMLGLDVEVDDDLVETDFGRWDGLTFAEVKQRWPAEHAAWMQDTSVAPPGGESVAAVARRVRRARDRILAAYPGRTVVVVSHVTPLKLLLCSALGAPAGAVFRMHLDTASLSEADWYPDGPALVRLVNDTSHLR